MIKEVERHRRQLDDLQKLISDGVSKDMLNDGLVLAAHLSKLFFIIKINFLHNINSSPPIFQTLCICKSSTKLPTVDFYYRNFSDQYIKHIQYIFHIRCLWKTKFFLDMEQVVDLLLKSGADANATDQTDHETPLHLTSELNKFYFYHFVQKILILFEIDFCMRQFKVINWPMSWIFDVCRRWKNCGIVDWKWSRCQSTGPNRTHDSTTFTFNWGSVHFISFPSECWFYNVLFFSWFRS